jgi:leader peptidase (prepilin peptidase)/N-methyltransferase
MVLLAVGIQFGLNYISTKRQYGFGRKIQVVAILLNALIVWRVVSLYGVSLTIGMICLIISILVSAIFVDYFHYILPDGYNLTIFIIGVGYVILHHQHWLKLIEGAVILTVIFLVLMIISGGKLGGGDLKMVAGLGLILGMNGLMQYLLVSFLTASLLCFFLLVFKFKKSDDIIPFGPFLAVGFIYFFV